MAHDPTHPRESAAEIVADAEYLLGDMDREDRLAWDAAMRGLSDDCTVDDLRDKLRRAVAYGYACTARGLAGAIVRKTMDPDAIVERICDAAHALDWWDASDAIDDLANWRLRGGYEPDPRIVKATAYTLATIGSPQADAILNRLAIVTGLNL